MLKTVILKLANIRYSGNSMSVFIQARASEVFPISYANIAISYLLIRSRGARISFRGGGDTGKGNM